MWLMLHTYRPLDASCRRQMSGNLPWFPVPAQLSPGQMLIIATNNRFSSFLCSSWFLQLVMCFNITIWEGIENILALNMASHDSRTLCNAPKTEWKEKVKSEMKIWFTHFENEKWNENALISRSRVKSEMKMSQNRDREWKVNWKCLEIEIEKWNFSRIFEKFLRIKKSRKFSNFVTNSFHLANFYFGIQQNTFGDGPWLRHVTCKAVWMDWVGNLWMHLCSDHCLVMLIKRKSESESFSVTFNLSLNLEV